MKNYHVVFKRDGKAVGFASLAKTKGLAIYDVLLRTDYDVDELVDVREVFGGYEHGI